MLLVWIGANTSASRDIRRWPALSTSRQTPQSISPSYRCVDPCDNFTVEGTALGGRWILTGYLWLAEVLIELFKPTGALIAIQKAMRLDPKATDLYLLQQGLAYNQLGRWDESISSLKP